MSFLGGIGSSFLSCLFFFLLNYLHFIEILSAWLSVLFSVSCFLFLVSFFRSTFT